MQNRFGKVYCLPVGQHEVIVINDVNMVQKLLTSRNPQHLNKPNEIYDKIFINSFRDGLVNSKFPVWSTHRKHLNHCFSYKSLQNYLTSMNKHCQDLIRNLTDPKPVSGQIADAKFIFDTIHYHLVKITADIVLGPEYLTNDIAAEYDNNLRVAQQSFFRAVVIPFLEFLPGWFLFPNLNKQKKAIQYMETFFQKITKEYRTQYEVAKQNSQPNNKIDTGVKPFRCIIQEMLYQGSTNKEITGEVAAFMLAGTKSTYVSLQMLMIHLAMNQDHQTRCREEIDLLISQKPNKYLNQEHFDIIDLANLKYLERCILESARLTPVFPIFVRKLDAPLKLSEDLELPTGTNVGVPVWTIHRDSDNFSNPEKFEPDRFLPKNVKTRHPFSFIPFSYGARNCIAYKQALMEIKVIMAWILRHYEITSTDKLDDVKLLFEMTIRPERNYNILLKRLNVQ